VRPCGIEFSDRHNEEHGDYKPLAFLPFDTLVLDVRKDCPVDLVAEIKSTAAIYQARSGEQFQISTCGQTVLLGSKAVPASNH